jgi:hypothetical protein
MDHRDIDQDAWAERYLTGRLSPEERERFEVHLVDCAACIDQVETARALQSGLAWLDQTGELRQTEKVVAAGRRSGAGVGLLTGWIPPPWMRRAAWAAGAVCAAGLLAALWSTTQRAWKAESELAAQRSAAAEAQQRLADVRAAEERERHARQQLEHRLEETRKAPTRIPVLALMAMRGAERPTLQLPPVPQPVVLSVEREEPLRFQAYRATLQSSAGAQLWQDRVTPGSRDAVIVALDSSLVPPGEYTLVLEGGTKGDRWTLVGRHAFRTAAPGAVR